MANFDSLAPSLRGDPGPPRVARPGVNFLQLLRSTRLVASTEIQKSTKNNGTISLGLDNNFDIKRTIMLETVDQVI